MTPRVTVLQLDTAFPRVPGDVGAPESYAAPPQILRVPGANVGSVVTDRPETIDIAPFEAALARATGDIVVTSCGFLSYWQDHLARRSLRPFLSSSLTALDALSARHPPEEVMILTFDSRRLTVAHLGRHRAYAASIVGLTADMHLSQVIRGDLGTLDRARAAREIVARVTDAKTPAHRHVLLECTNLPPYRKAIAQAAGLPVTDILTLVEATCPGAIATPFN